MENHAPSNRIDEERQQRQHAQIRRLLRLFDEEARLRRELADVRRRLDELLTGSADDE
jgi:hypothetical protein